MPPAKSANDLSTFIKDSELLIISDFEGTTPKTQFEKFAEYARGGAEGVKNKKVIYLGDVFDSTVLLKSKESTESKEGCVQDDNYCALQSVKLLVDNPAQCKYVVGNRDLNKIKLLPFFQFKTGEKWWNPAGATSYESIVDKLLAEDEKEVWLVGGKDAAGKDKDTTMDFFKPFWNIGKWNTKKSITARATKNYTKIYDRFEALFGVDGIEGTMSAINTLKSIPNEMFASQSDNMTIDKFIAKLTKKTADKNVVRAALVITLFMRMLDKDLWKEGDAAQKEKKVGDFGALDGYLYKYITEAKPAYYAVSDQEKNLLLFAHGGITKDFVTGKGTKATELLATVKWDEVLNLQPPPLTGGAGNPITDSIDNFNGKYNELLTAFFAKKYEGTPAPAKLEDYTGMLTLLQLSAGFANPKIKEKFTVEGGEFKDDKLSPIQRKDASYENLDEFISPYNKIYNIFGHYSVSAGYSFGKSTGSAKTYFINTDYSSSLFKDGIDCTDDYNDNYLQLKLDTKTNRLFLDGTVILNGKYTPYTSATPELQNASDDAAVFKTIKDSKNNILDKYYIHGGAAPPQPLRIEFSNDVNLLGDDIMKYSENLPVAVEGDTVLIFGTQTAVTPGNKQIIFNGVAKLQDNENYKVYSTTSYLLPYPKTGFIFIPTGIIAGDVVTLMPTTQNEVPSIVNVVAINEAATGGAAPTTVTVVNAAGIKTSNVPIANIEPVDPAVLESAKTAVLQAELQPSSATSAETKTPLQEVAAAVVANPIIYSVPNKKNNNQVAMAEAKAGEPIYATVNPDEDNPTVAMAEARVGVPIYEDLKLLNAAAAEEEKRNKKAATAPPKTEQDIEKNIEELILWKTWYRNFYKLAINKDDLIEMGHNIKNKTDKSNFNAKIFNCIIKFKGIVDKNENVYYKNKIVEVLKPYEQTFNPTLKDSKSNTILINKISNTIDDINKEVDSKFAEFKRQILNNDLRQLKQNINDNNFFEYFTDVNLLLSHLPSSAKDNFDIASHLTNYKFMNSYFNNAKEDSVKYEKTKAKLTDFINKKKKDFELESRFKMTSATTIMAYYIEGLNKKFNIGDKVVYETLVRANGGGPLKKEGGGVNELEPWEYYNSQNNTRTISCKGTITAIDIITNDLKPILQYTIDCGDGKIKTAFYNADIKPAQQGGFIRKRNKKTKKSYYSHKHKKTIRKDKKSKHKKQTLRDKKQRKNKKTKRRRT